MRPASASRDQRRLSATHAISVSVVSGQSITGGAVILLYSVTKIGFDAALWDNFNAIKREIAFFAALAVLSIFGGGTYFRPKNLLKAPSSSLLGADRDVSENSVKKVSGIDA